MTAETAYNVIQALPRKEKPRLYRMLGVPVPEVRLKKKPIITKADAMEIALKFFKPKL